MIFSSVSRYSAGICSTVSTLRMPLRSPHITFREILIGSDPEISVLDLPILSQFPRIVNPYDAALLQHVVPVGDPRERPDVLVDQEDRHPGGLQPADGLVDLGAHHRRQALGRLVED